MAETVKSRACIFSVSHSTFLRVLQKMTAWVMVSVSYKSHRVSNFHSYNMSPTPCVSTVTTVVTLQTTQQFLFQSFTLYLAHFTCLCSVYLVPPLWMGWGVVCVNKSIK